MTAKDEEEVARARRYLSRALKSLSGNGKVKLANEFHRILTYYNVITMFHFQASGCIPEPQNVRSVPPVGAPGANQRPNTRK